MDSRFIYIVGQPDPQSDAPHTIRSLDYKVGLLLDKNLTIKQPEHYDRIELVDFSQLDTELERLKKLDLSIEGLLCTYENYIVAKAKLGTFFNIPAPSVESARLSTDKSLMRQAFLDADRTISPEFASVKTVEAAVSFANEHGYPLIIKPTNLVKSLLVLKSDTESELRENMAYALETIQKLYQKYRIYERTPQLLIEEFIEGQQCSIAAFVDADGTPHFCDGIVALRNAQDIGVSDNYLFSRTLPASYDSALTNEMFRVAEAGIRALKMRSIPAHVELMYSQKGVKIIEIGARIGGYRPRMYRYSYGVDLTAQEIQLALGLIPNLHGTFHAYSAVYELFSDTEGVFASISGSEDTSHFTYYRETVQPGSPTGPAKNGYKAAAIVIVVHKDERIFKEYCRAAEVLKVVVS